MEVSDEDWLFAIDVEWLLRNDSTQETKKEMIPKQRRKSLNTVTRRRSSVGSSLKAVKETRIMQRNMKTNLDHHLSVISNAIEEQQNKLKDQGKKIEKQDKVICALTHTIVELTEQFETQKNKQNHQEKLLEIIQHDTDIVTENIKKQIQQLLKNVKKLDEKVDQFLLEQAIAAEDKKNTDRYGEHMWTIQNFNRRLRRIQLGKSEDPIRSEPFYTGSPGYKLCIWAYLNGRGKSLGRAMSVYGKVMAGEFDPLLKWPIRPQFTFTIFEQHCGHREPRNIVRTRRVHEIKREEYVKGGIPRPQTDERSIIIGFDDFVTHEELRSCGYLREDNVFLKIEAEILV